MKPVNDGDELLRAIGEVARTGAGYAVSFFASPADTTRWLREHTLSTLSCAGTLLVLRRDQGLLRVHHVTPEASALRQALQALAASAPAGPWVADLVGRPQDTIAVGEAYLDAGFREHARLERMQRVRAANLPAVPAGNQVELAGPDDVPALHAFMERWLDPLSEQIQSAPALADAVAAGEVLVVRDQAVLAGFLIHATTGRSSTLRYWHVAPGRRGQGIGAQLMHVFLQRCADSARIVLWVHADNANAIACYRHYGFHADGMVDRIMVKQTEGDSSRATHP